MRFCDLQYAIGLAHMWFRTWCVGPGCNCCTADEKRAKIMWHLKRRLASCRACRSRI